MLFLMMLATASSSQAMIDSPPQVNAFSKLEIAPDCLSVYVTAEEEPEHDLRGRGYRILTLWLENSCKKQIRLSDIRHLYAGKSADRGFSKEKKFRIAHAVRDQYGFVEQKGSAAIRFNKGESPCQLGRLDTSAPPLSCGAFILDPHNAMGFVYNVPMVFEWDGEDGVRIRGVVDQKAEKPAKLPNIENYDTGKKPFWEKEPETPPEPDAGKGE